MWGLRSAAVLGVLVAAAAAFAIPTDASAQDPESTTGSISGQVRSADGEALAGASLTVAGTQLGAVTDADGTFRIDDVPAGDQSVRASMIGYADEDVPVTVAAGESATATITLETNALALPEVVAVGYATQRARDVTGAVTTVTSEQLNPLATTSINQMLQGKAPGLVMSTRSAQPGGGVSVNVRGAISPRGNNTPLYVIDGVPVTEYQSSVPDLLDADLGFYGGVDRDPLSDLNPNDIESITVLKDASAAAIYGSAAANGVVLITTKDGAPGDIQVQYTGSYTTQTPHDYFPLLNAQGFIEQQQRLSYERYLFDNQLAPYGSADPSTVPPYIPLFTESDTDATGAGTDWLDQVTRQGHGHEHNVSLSGGSENTFGHLSFNYRDDDAILSNSSLTRYGGRVNLRQRISDAVRLSLRVSAARLDGDNAATGENAGGPEKYNMLQSAYSYAPTVPARDALGNYSYSYNRLVMNPVAFLSIEDQSTTTSLFFAPELNVDLTPALRLSVTGQIDQEKTTRSFYLPRTANNVQAPEGMAQKAESSIDNYSVESYLTYTGDIGAARLTLVGGAGYYESGTESFGAQGVGFFTDAFGANNLSVASNQLQTIITSDRTGRTKLSQFGRADVSWRDRYVLSLVARRDGSSIFSENHKYGIFPAVSAAWILSDEPFLRGVEQISQLKLRAGYGTAGNESILAGNTLELYSPGYPFLIGNTLYNGVALSQVANPDLRWEKVSTFNVGVDFGLWGQRVNGSVDYFVKTARDLLDFNPLPANNAVGLVADNVGATRSRGFEVALHTANVTGSTFEWYSDVNVSHYEATWLERNPRVALPSYVGERDAIDAIYGWETDGIIKTPDDRPAHMPDANLGNLRYVDQNGDGELDESDIVILGNGSPRWTVGINNTLRYGPIDLTVYAYGNLGPERINTYAPNAFGVSQLTNPENTTIYATDIWSSMNPDGTRPGVAANPYDSRNPEEDDFDLHDASFLRLQSVTLGYVVPRSWFGRDTSVQSARVFVDLQNLGVLTDYPGFDPEYTEVNPYPKAYAATFGVSVNF